MTKRMLIDATHAEETRVVVLDGNRLEDFDVETSTKRQLKGNIYLAKVVRVEPSLQAAFVEYGGNRHGFLAFSEIHPDYYQIPVADRQRLIEMEAEEARREEEEQERALAEAAVPPQSAPEAEPAPEALREEAPPTGPEPEAAGARAESASPPITEEPQPSEGPNEGETERQAAQALSIETDRITAPAHSVAEMRTEDEPPASPSPEGFDDESSHSAPPLPEPAGQDEPFADSRSQTAEPEPMAEPERAPEAGPIAHQESIAEAHPIAPWSSQSDLPPSAETVAELSPADPSDPEPAEPDTSSGHNETDILEAVPETPPPETIGGEAEDARERRAPPRFLRNYKIQEVIKRRQILLVQVVKEERGTKGAALTTYLSLAGRFCVLMPNSPRGGGISRKITSPTDRRRLKDVMAELDIPKGMGLIVRTAGANRPKPEIKRDCEYLLRLWDDIREHTLRSVAPAVIYEEASLIKRAIRDVYSRDIDEILVDGEDGWRAAHEFMRMLMPAHAKKVQLWRETSQPLFARYQVEAQLDAMLLPTVQLRSGGYLVINQAEALVAIDVNSGRSTRERNVEETALRTNLEAADEIARQLRLRDLAGLIVIDFIDMELKKHNGMVERRLKEALKNDRARIQVGHISHFGLLEMSRQRLRPSLAETSFIPCPHCGGTGHVRSIESAAIHVLRGVEEEGGRRRSAEIIVFASTPVALYILNHKRERVREIELRYAMHLTIMGDDTQIAPQFRLERVRAQTQVEAVPVVTPDVLPSAALEEEEEETLGEEEEGEESAEPAEAQTEAADASSADEERRRRRRRRRRRGGRREEGETAPAAEPPIVADIPAEWAEQPEEHPATADSPSHVEGVPEPVEEPEPDEAAAQRRNRRGGRRRRRAPGEAALPMIPPDAEQPDLPAIYTGPTPANPFGGHAFDIFDVLERAEASISSSATDQPTQLPPEPTLDEPAPEPATAANAERAPAKSELQPAAAEPELSQAEPELSEDLTAVDAPAIAAGEGDGADSEPEPPSIAPEPEPVIRPIVVGSSEDQVVEPKRGWWRRS